MTDLLIAKCDSDANDLGDHLDIKGIPHLEFFVPGASSTRYNGGRDGASLLRFLFQQCSGTSSHFDYELAVSLLQGLEKQGYPGVAHEAIDKPAADQKQSTMQVPVVLLSAGCCLCICLARELSIGHGILCVLCCVGVLFDGR